MRILVVVLISVSVLALMLGLAYRRGWFYTPSEYAGDGRIEDYGFASQPRYRIIFPSITLDAPGTYTYRIAGAPPLGLGLGLQNFDRSEIIRMQSSSAVVGFRLVDSSGRILAEDRAPLMDWIYAGEVPRPDYAELWHEGFRAIDFDWQEEYLLEVRIESVDAAVIGISLEPTLQGTGTELP